jgi:hypothetical protein
MTQEFDYYMIASAGNADFPLLECDDEVNPRALRFLAYDEPAEIESPVALCFNEDTTTKNPRMADYHHLSGAAVFSQKIYDVLAPLNLDGVQFVPAVVNGNKGEKYENYWIQHTFKPIECFDKEESVYETDDFADDGSWDNVEKVSLNKKQLAKIPLEKRLIFVSKETSRFELYHKSVVDAIMAVNPEGLTFIPVEEWHEGIQFEPFK